MNFCSWAMFLSSNILAENAFESTFDTKLADMDYVSSRKI